MKAHRLSCRHDWSMRRGGRSLYVGCRLCYAEVRLEVLDTPSTWYVSSTVISAGGGVSVAELEELSDRVFELVVEMPLAA